MEKISENCGIDQDSSMMQGWKKKKNIRKAITQCRMLSRNRTDIFMWAELIVTVINEIHNFSSALNVAEWQHPGRQ